MDAYGVPDGYRDKPATPPPDKPFKPRPPPGVCVTALPQTQKARVIDLLKSLQWKAVPGHKRRWYCPCCEAIWRTRYNDYPEHMESCALVAMIKELGDTGG